MKKLEFYLKQSQENLFNLLVDQYEDIIISRNNYILVQGEAPIMLIAHLDTVHRELVKRIYKRSKGNVLKSPQGIGGDDRCGVYALNKVYELSKIKPFLLFTCNEEIGCCGASRFAEDYTNNKLPKNLDNLKLLVEIDRKGSCDAVYYNCDNPKFEDYITSKGFITSNGSYSDISIIAPTLGVAAVNLSSGYYYHHTLDEYININELENVIKIVVEIVEESTSPDFPKYEYIEKNYYKMFSFIDLV